MLLELIGRIRPVQSDAWKQVAKEFNEEGRKRLFPNRPSHTLKRRFSRLYLDRAGRSTTNDDNIEEAKRLRGIIDAMVSTQLVSRGRTHRISSSLSPHSCSFGTAAAEW